MSAKVSTPSTAKPQRDGFLRRVVDFVGADNLSLIFALIVLVLLITIVSRWFGMAGRRQVLLLAEYHEQPRPGRGGRRPAGDRRDGGHYRRRARHLGRLDRLGRLGRRRLGAGRRRHRRLDRLSAHRQRADRRHGRHPGRRGLRHHQRLDRHHPACQPDHRHAGYAGRFWRHRLPAGARRQADRRGHAARLHLAGTGPFPDRRPHPAAWAATGPASRC